MTKISALAVGAGLVLAASAASAQNKPMVLKFAGWAPPQINVNVVSQRWAKQVEAASGGTVKIQFFWNSIANARTVYDVVRTGVADIGWILQPLVRGKFRKTSVVALPFLVRNSTEGSVALWNLYSKGLISGEYDQVKPLGIAALLRIPLEIFPEPSSASQGDRSTWYGNLIVDNKKITRGDLWGYYRN